MELENTTANLDTTLLWFAGLFFGILIIVGIVMYLSERFKDINYAKMELHRAYDEEEYRYWRRELTICRLLIIPFISYDTAKKIVRFFSRGKHAKKDKHNDGLTSLLLPSFLGIMICAVCLAGGTFAWFTASQSTATQVIQAANYSVETTINDSAITPNEDGTYTLAQGTYTVKLTATGSASTGYCILKLGDTKIVTQQIPTIENTDENSITFTLEINQAVDLEIIAQWGTSASKEKKLLNGNTYTYGVAEPTVTTNTEEEIEQGTTEQTTEITDTDIYTVVSGDTLSGIADKYKTTAEKLKVYNNLTSNTIQVGQKLNIPPADYEIPKTETTTSTVQEREQTPTEPNTTSTAQTSSITEMDSTISNISN